MQAWTLSTRKLDTLMNNKYTYKQDVTKAFLKHFLIGPFSMGEPTDTFVTLYISISLTKLQLDFGH